MARTGSAGLGLVLTTGAGALALVGTVLVRRRRVSEPNYLEFGLLMILVPLLSPQGWDYVLLIAAPARSASSTGGARCGCRGRSYWRWRSRS